MAIAYIEADRFIVYAKRGELGASKRGIRNAHWPLICFGKLSDAEEDLGLVRKFTYQLEMRPALERIFMELGRPFEVLERQDCEDRVADVIAGERSTLHSS